jgi:hypothetical protein
MTLAQGCIAIAVTKVAKLRLSQALGSRTLIPEYFIDAVPCSLRSACLIPNYNKCKLRGMN